MTNLSDISKKIVVSVQSRMEEEQSNAEVSNFIYSYRVHIENKSDQRVQLISRFWDILDIIAGPRIVEGKGVIGKQPIIEPGQAYAYESWCPLMAEVGEMAGNYTFLNLENEEIFQVEIPKIRLSPEYWLN